MDGQQQVRFTRPGLEGIERAHTSMPELRIALRDHVRQGCRDEERKEPPRPLGNACPASNQGRAIANEPIHDGLQRSPLDPRHGNRALSR
jgi:hypothetical protein